MHISLIGHRITLISNYFDPLTDGGIGCASKIYNSKQQAAILDQTKSVAEAGLQLVYYAKVFVYISTDTDGLSSALNIV